LIGQLILAWHGAQVLLALLASSAAGGPAAPHQLHCFAQPSRCGYPDATNSGVPPGTRLTPSGSLTVSDDGTTLDGLDIAGTVTVAADDVTIENSRIRPRSGGSGSYAVILNDGADDFAIVASEVAGPRRRGHGLESAVWNHYGNPRAVAVGSYFHRCTDCWEGPGSFLDDYMVVDAGYPESHNEDIYVCGGAVRVDHSTLINRRNQTATVFGDTAGCGGNRFVVTDSLLAGGGFVLYPQANSDSRIGRTTVVGNRFARCGTAAVYDAGSGGSSCRSGADAHGLYPYGGYYSVSAYYYGGHGQTWRRNFWDDNLRPVCPQGSC
jgi:hypothetical protein